MREMFTAHMENKKIAEELLAQTRSQQDVYEYAIRREKGIENSRTMKTNPFGNQVTATKQELVYYINTRGRSSFASNQVPQRGRGNFRGRVYPRGQKNTRGQSQQKRNPYPNTQKQCYKCGDLFGQNHLQSYPAKEKICSKCVKRGDFAIVCRSGNVNYMEDRNNDEEQEETESESQGTELDPVAFADFTSKDGWGEHHVDNFSVRAISEAFESKNTTSLSEDHSNRHIIKLKTKTENLFAIADSGSPMLFINEKTAWRLQDNVKSAVFKQIPTGDTARNLACYNGETIFRKGRLIVTIESGGWKIIAAPFIIVDNQKENIIGRNILPQIGLKLVQEKQKHGDVLNIREQEESNLEIKEWVKISFPQQCIRVGMSKNHVMRTQLEPRNANTISRNFIPVQQRGRRVPVHLQGRVEKELNKVMDQKHIKIWINDMLRSAIH